MDCGSNQWRDRGMTPMLPRAWVLVLLHLWVGLSLYVIRETGTMRIREPSKRWTPWVGGQACLHLIFLKDKPFGFHIVGWSIWFTWIPPFWSGGHSGWLKIKLRSVVNSVYAIYFLCLGFWVDLRKLLGEREMASMFATDVNYSVDSFSSWVHVILTRASRELEGPWRLLPPFKGEHLERTQTSWLAPFYHPRKGKVLDSHMVDWKYRVDQDIPDWVGHSDWKI